MILIADSGSSKCDWTIANKQQAIKEIQTMGFNPWHHSAELITEKVEAAFQNEDKNAITTIYFYGSGSSTDNKKATIKNALAKVFPKANIHVSHDMDASAIASCGNKAGIACILGTGSNICLWNGKTIVPQTNFYGLGYILGDEGSGSALGKQLIKDFLYGNMPPNISFKLKTDGLHKDEIINKVYNLGSSNVYLASFTHFIFENRNEPYIQTLILNNFDVFFKTHVTQFENYQTLPVNFIGSIAFLFQTELKTIAQKYGATIETIIKQPIENLVAYHLKHL